MRKVSNLNNDYLGKVLVLGKGVTGTDVKNYLLTQNSRVCDLDVCDEETFDASKSYDLCIASPGISEFSELYLNAKANCKEIISEIEFAYRESEEDSIWIAITGTNGKTTTTQLTNHILRDANINSVAVGNIGKTCISCVDGKQKFYVAECSSYQLASTNFFCPCACAILNITPDHIKWHKNLDNYKKAKLNIFKNCKDDATSLVFLENSLMEQLLASNKFKCEVVSDKTSRYISLVSSVYEDMQIKGDHNIQNAVCATTLCAHFGIEEDVIKKSLCTFAPLEHRIEPCGVFGGVQYFNDSKATNVDSTIKALSAFNNQGNVILLLGGTDKMSDLSELVEVCKKKIGEKQLVKCVICYGEALDRFFNAFRELASSGIKVEKCEHMQDAFVTARSNAHSGDIVLLSPACSSFDEFSNFEERGKAFKEMVIQSLGKKC